MIYAQWLLCILLLVMLIVKRDFIIAFIKKQLWGIHAKPSKWTKRVLMIIPFALLVSLYVTSSNARLKENPNDKLLPSLTKMVDATERAAFEENKRTGEYQMLEDTLVSLKRLGVGISLAAFIGLLIGINTAMFPAIKAMFMSFITFLSNIPPLAILPILFISLGVDELGKTALIFIGIFLLISRHIFLSVLEIPKERINKILTLGATQFQLIYQVLLPQIMPKLIDGVRLSLGSAWLFLIAAEAIASTSGLGYRIYLVRRYLAMDMIIPYVCWITLLGFAMDRLLVLVLKLKYPWYVVAKK